MYIDINNDLLLMSLLFLLSLLMTVTIIEEVIKNIIKKEYNKMGGLKVLPIGLTILTLILWSIFYYFSNPTNI